MAWITRLALFRFTGLKRSRIAVTTTSLLVVLDLGRSINARNGYATPVSVWRPSPVEYADLTWPPGADLPSNAPMGARVYAQRISLLYRVSLSLANTNVGDLRVRRAQTLILMLPDTPPRGNHASLRAAWRSETSVRKFTGGRPLGD